MTTAGVDRDEHLSLRRLEGIVDLIAVCRLDDNLSPLSGEQTPTPVCGPQPQHKRQPSSVQQHLTLADSEGKVGFEAWAIGSNR